MYRYIIGCDADGVLTDLSAHNIRAGKKAFHREPVRPDSYALDEMFDVSDVPKLIKYAKAFGIFRRYCRAEPPRTGAAEVIRELSESGYDFHAVTARKFAADSDLLGSITRKWFGKWLRKYEISFRSVHFCSEENSPTDKLLSCRKLGVDAMIEDRPDNALFLAENGIRVFMPDASYNQDTAHENIIRVTTWEDIRSGLLSLDKPCDTNFIRIMPDRLNTLSDLERRQYFRAYQRHLQHTEFDHRKSLRSDRRFRILYRILKMPVSLFFRVRTFGKENVPFQDGFIIAANHCDSSDQYRLGLALGNRPFTGYAAKEIEKTFRGRLFSFTGLGVFIDRSDRENKHEASELMASYVAHGKTAMIFPEGTRKNKTPEGRALFQNRFKPGTVVLAQKTGTGILPTAINSFGKHALVRFGEMIYVSPNDDIEKKNRELELAVAKLSMENISIYLLEKGRSAELEAEKAKYEKYIE